MKDINPFPDTPAVKHQINTHFYPDVTMINRNAMYHLFIIFVQLTHFCIFRCLNLILFDHDVLIVNASLRINQTKHSLMTEGECMSVTWCRDYESEYEQDVKG